jgi:hypothetical protein
VPALIVNVQTGGELISIPASLTLTAADAPAMKRLQINSSPNRSAKDDQAAGRRSRAVRLALDLLTASW